jgi:ABC-type glycerol-3-phosphate transport system substrate-binding protein
LLGAPEGFLFPAGDERALFTLAQYLALDGDLLDSEGEVALQAAVLSDIFAFYRSLSTAAVLPPTATQHTSASASWDSFRSGRIGSALAPLSGYINERNPESTTGVPIPSRDSGIALSYTWSWVVAADRPERQPLVHEFLAWMTDPSFVGNWTYALGMIPPNSASLAAWPENSDLVVASQLVTVMRAQPPDEIINIVGPALQSSTAELLVGGISPESASARAVNLVRTDE